MHVLKFKYLFLFFITIIFVTIAIVFIIKSNSFKVPEKSNFAVTIQYDKKENSVTAELKNLSNSNYDIVVGSTAEFFMDMHITSNGKELPFVKDLSAVNLKLPKKSSLKNTIPMENYPKWDDMYATVDFSVIDKKTSQEYKLTIKSETIYNEKME